MKQLATQLREMAAGLRASSLDFERLANILDPPPEPESCGADEVEKVIKKQIVPESTFVVKDLLPFLPKRYGNYIVNQILYRMTKSRYYSSLVEQVQKGGGSGAGHKPAVYRRKKEKNEQRRS